VKRSVASVIFNDDKTKVLLIKRRDVPVWVLPGGGVEPGEEPSAAAIRESKEETGLTVSIVRQVAEYSPINLLSNLTFLYECTSTAGSLSTGNETQEIAFFSIENTPKLFFFIHRDWLEDALRNEAKVIHKRLEKISYWGLSRYFLSHPIHVIRFALSRLGLPLNTR